MRIDGHRVGSASSVARAMARRDLLQPVAYRAERRQLAKARKASFFDAAEQAVEDLLGVSLFEDCTERCASVTPPVGVPQSDTRLPGVLRCSIVAEALRTCLGEQGDSVWKHGMRALAACPSTYLKVGGIGMSMIGFRWDKQGRPPTSEETSPIATVSARRPSVSRIRVAADPVEDRPEPAPPSLRRGCRAGPAEDAAGRGLRQQAAAAKRKQ